MVLPLTLVNTSSRYCPERLIRYSLVFLYTSEIIAGPLRFLLGNSGLYSLVYLPKLEIAGLTIFLIVVRRSVSAEFIATIAILLIFTLVGLLDLPNFKQPLDAVWNLIPFVFSLIIARDFYENLQKYRIAFLILFAIAVGGVLYNFFFDFPWSGQTFQIGNTQIQTARKWGNAYFSRISGFSRASFVAAMQIMVLSVILVQLTKSKFFGAIIWILAGIGIVLTTTKGVILSYFICTIFALPRFTVSWSTQTGKFLSWLMFCGFSIFFMAEMIVLPLLSVVYHFQIGASSIAIELLLLSFQDRLVETWPNALGLLHGWVSFISGNGLGGIGAPQAFYDSANYNPADNLFVFCSFNLGYRCLYLS